MTGDLNLNSNRIVNMTNPSNDNDAVTKWYMHRYTMIGSRDDNGNFDCKNEIIWNNKNSGNNADLHNLGYIKQHFILSNGTNSMSGDLNMNNNKITNLGSGADDTDSINKKQLDDGLSSKANTLELTNYVKKDGSVSMTGNLNMNNNKITNLANPVNDNDATNKSYLDNEIKKYFFSFNYTIKYSP